MGKFCSNCGHPVKPGNAFCTFCGARLQPSAAPQPPQPPQQMMQDLQAARQILLSQPLPDYRRASACLQDAARYGQTAELQKLQQLVQFYQQADMLRQQELSLMPRNAQGQAMHQAPGGQSMYQVSGVQGQMPVQQGQMAQGRQGATGPLQTIPAQGGTAANGGHPSQHGQHQQQSGGPSALKTAAAGFAGAAAGTMLANALHNSSGSPGLGMSQASAAPLTNSGYTDSGADTYTNESADTTDYSGVSTEEESYTDESADDSSDDSSSWFGSDDSSDDDSSDDGGSWFGGDDSSDDDGGWFGGDDDDGGLF